MIPDANGTPKRHLQKTGTTSSPTSIARQPSLAGDGIAHSMRPMMQVPSPSDHCALAWQLSQQGNERLLVYVCPDVRSYRQLSEEVSFFMQHRRQQLWLFPAWEILPYDRVSPHRSIVGQRFATLSRLLRTPSPSGVLITSLAAWLQRIAPPSTVARHVWQLKVGDVLDPVRLREQLAEAGMLATERVLSEGEYAMRGSVFDVWPANEPMPLRLDLFGDEIESIQRFDPESQRSTESLKSFTSAPAREMILDAEVRERFATAFLSRFPQHRQHPMLKSVREGRPFPGMEALLPLAYEHTARLQDYLPDDYQLCSNADLAEQQQQFASHVRQQFEMQRSLSDVAISPQELFAIETPVSACSLPLRAEAPPSKAAFDHQHHALQRLLAELDTRLAEGWRILLVAHGMGQRDHMLEVMRPLQDKIPCCQGLHDWPENSPMAACIGFLQAGMADAQAKLLILTGNELLGQRLRRPHRRHTLPRSDAFNSLAEMKQGDPVVHEDHGIGLFQGLESRDDGEDAYDVIRVEYADGAQVFVPVENLDRLHRYTGEQVPKLDKLGSEKWKRTRQRAKRDLLDMAHELIAIEAARARVQRPAYALQGQLLSDYEEFSARFPFEETDDQMAAIQAVEKDLTTPGAMDRVICGDVGFGKTEVAMRAAFIVAAAGKQVAVLAPTTVLATQHAKNFGDRFAGCGFRIELLCRLQGQKDSKRICRELEGGVIRIIIGTHRLLGENIRFADLGLVIVDEEQRFGVRHKQQLKQLQAGVDLLTLSATPIPRTLHQTLAGLRTISTITTPPAEREAIRTIVQPYSRTQALEAIRRELYRGGQVYYLHNHVKSIERIAEQLRESLPEADIGIAHGQMGAARLDQQMMAFYEGRLNILLCTTIVESGLDVPNANTLIVERADLLGLAQLHQIRGRVGRSHRQAYAYLFTPDPRAMTADARQRLQAIAEHTELGAGFLLARQDMEIRGAGNLLGREQSGRMDEIGLDLYLDMLNEAIAEARGERLEPEQECAMHIGLHAVLPAEYVPQPGERLALYRRIARARDDAALRLLFEEISDRFGRMPEVVRRTLELSRLRWRARQLRLLSIRAGAQGWIIAFSEQSPIDPMALMQRVQQQPQYFRMTPDGHLTLLQQATDPLERMRQTCNFFDELLIA